MLNIETLQGLLTTSAFVLPLIIALVQLVKTTLPNLDKRFIPSISCLIGISAGLSLVQLSATGAAVGLILGLSATGLWENGSKINSNNVPSPTQIGE